MSDRLPAELGGLPAGAPVRPVTPYQYPAVHDMPPPRSTSPMTEDEQMRLEKDLQAARDRQEGQVGRGGAAKKTAPVTSKKAAPVTKKQTSGPIIIPPAGVKTNP